MLFIFFSKLDVTRNNKCIRVFFFDIIPNQPMDISSWALDFALAKYVDAQFLVSYSIELYRIEKRWCKMECELFIFEREMPKSVKKVSFKYWPVSGLIAGWLVVVRGGFFFEIVCPSKN